MHVLHHDQPILNIHFGQSKSERSPIDPTEKRTEQPTSDFLKIMSGVTIMSNITEIFKKRKAGSKLKAYMLYHLMLNSNVEKRGEKHEGLTEDEDDEDLVSTDIKGLKFTCHEVSGNDNSIFSTLSCV